MMMNRLVLTHRKLRKLAICTYVSSLVSVMKSELSRISAIIFRSNLLFLYN